MIRNNNWRKVCVYVNVWKFVRAPTTTTLSFSFFSAFLFPKLKTDKGEKRKERKKAILEIEKGYTFHKNVGWEKITRNENRRDIPYKSLLQQPLLETSQRESVLCYINLPNCSHLLFLLDALCPPDLRNIERRFSLIQGHSNDVQVVLNCRCRQVHVLMYLYLSPLL